MDQESPSKDVNNKKPSIIDFKEGCRIEARDHLGDKWWEAKVIEVDQEGREVLVHFQGWNGRHDEWIKMDSPRLQPLHRRSRRLSTGPVESPGPSSTGTTPSSSVSPAPSLYSVGEEVLALWKQNRKFPATILNIQEDGGYLVQFYDGFEKVVRGQCIRRIGKTDLEFVKQCKEEIVSNGDKEILEDNNVEDQRKENGDGSSKLRRERKSKFNVREILNLNPAKKPPTTSSSRDQESLHKIGNGGEVKRHSKENDFTSDDLVDLNDSLDVKSEKSISETGSEGTPSEKENFNCEVMGKFRSKSKDPVTDKMGGDTVGKRERKRKRFADEEPELPALKASKKSNTPVLKAAKPSPKPSSKSDSVQNSQILSPQVSKGNKINKKAATPELSKKKSKDKSRDDPDPKSKPSSTLNSRSVRNNSAVDGGNKSEKLRDKSFPYLNFDFSLPQEKQVSNLKEGVTIPGPKKPLMMKSTKLPTGWRKKVVLRGVNQLKWEVIIENALGKSFKSRAELIRYFEEQKFDGNMDHFDFNLDTTLRKIRTIWRANMNKNDFKPQTNGVKEESSDTSFSDLESRVPPVIVNPKIPNSQSKSKSSKSLDKLKIDPPSQLSDTSLTSSPSLQSPVSINTAPSSSQPSTPATSPNSSLIIKGNASETGQGVRCPLATCNKLFRNDKLLQMHVKHYHPEYAPGDSPTVTDLAAIRTKKEELANGIDVNPLKSPEMTSLSQDDQFKVPDQKLLLSPVVERLSEVDSDHVDTEAVTDGGQDTVAMDVDTQDQDQLQDTPKVSKSRPRRLRTDSMLSVASDQVFTPPASPLDPSLTPSLTLKRSKKGSAPSTPPGELKDGIETMSEGEVVHCTCINTEGDGMMVQCDSCLTWQHGACLGIDTTDQVPDRYICSICTCPPLARQSSLYNFDMDWIREGKLSRLAKDPDETLSEEVTESEADGTQLKTLSGLMTDLVNLSSILHSLQCKLLVARHKNNPKVFMWCNVWDESACAAPEEEQQPGAFINPPDQSVGSMETETDNTFETVPEETMEESTESDVKCDQKDAMSKEQDKAAESDSKLEHLSNGETSSEENPFQDETPNETKVEESSNKTEPSKEDTKTDPVKSSPEQNSTTVVNGCSEDAKEELTNGEVKEEDKNIEEAESSKEKENIAQPLVSAPVDNQSSFGSQLTEYFSTEEGFDLQTLLPSVSEMARMLPDVIKDISGSLTSGPSTFSAPPVLPPPNIIPEPKRLDREECRQNLLVHIESLQKHVEDRLEAVEMAIEDIERKRKDYPGALTGMSVSSRMQDVKSAKIVNDCLPDKL